MKLLKAMMILLLIGGCVSFSAVAETAMQSEMDGFLKEKEETRKQFDRMKAGKEKTSGVEEKNSGVQFVPPVSVPQVAIAQGGPAIVVPNPVGEYLFSGNADDTSANANHAQVTGALLTQDRGGHENSAYIFYERPHRIDIPRIAANTFSTQSFTVSFWIKTKDDGGMKALVTNQISQSSTNPYWGFFLTSQNHMAFYLKNQEGQTAYVNATINDGNWHQVTGLRNADANTMSLYVDGALVMTRAGVSGSVDSGGKIEVGDHKNLMFVGRIDDIRLWNQALNTSVLTEIHKNDIVSPEPASQDTEPESPGIPAPVGMYMFNGNADDSSGNGNHGIVTGAELVEDRAGNTDRAYLFYQRIHKIKIPSIPQNTFTTGSFTASFWVKTKDMSGAVVHLLTNDSGSSPFWGFRYGGTQGSVTFILRNQEGDTAQIQSGPISDGAWHHITGTRNAANNTMSLYVDSALVNTRPGVTGSVDSLGPIHAGDHKNLLFLGRMDDVVLWDKAFSESKMAEYHALTANLPLTYAVSPDADNKQEPVGTYAFDGDATDASPEHNDGIVNEAHPSPDRFGRENMAYCFYERNNRIKVPMIPANTFSKGSFTVSLRVKINETISGVWPGIVTNESSPSQKWGIYLTANKSLAFFVRNKEGSFTSITHPVALGTWYHVIAVRDAAANTIRLYVDNDLVESRSGVEGDLNSGGQILIGDGSNLLFRGCIDDVTLWRRALGDQEIREMNQGFDVLSPVSVPIENKKIIEKKTLNKQHLLPKK